MGRALDRALSDGEPDLIPTQAALIARIDPLEQLGTVQRRRLDAAHDLQLSGVIDACEAIAFGDLQPPAGGVVSVWTKRTHLPSSTPGVTTLANGVRTRTTLMYSLVGGEGPSAWNLPVLIEPAREPEDVVQLGLQAIELGVRGRELVRRYAPQAGAARLGSLPLLLGTVRPAQWQPVSNRIVGPPVPVSQLPAFADQLEQLTCANIPFIAQAFVNEISEFQLPEGWYLVLAETAGADAERPGGVAGLATRVRAHAHDVLLGAGLARGRGLVERVPDVVDEAYVTVGTVTARSTFGTATFRGVSHISVVGDEPGRESFAITNLPRDEAGMNRLALGIEGLFGSLAHRTACRRRAERFSARIELPTQSIPAARRVFGITVMAFTGTVLDRAGRLAR